MASSKHQGQAVGRTCGSSNRSVLALRSCRSLLPNPHCYLHIWHLVLFKESRAPSWGLWRVQGWATQAQWVFKEVVWLLSQKGCTCDSDLGMCHLGFILCSALTYLPMYSLLQKDLFNHPKTGGGEERIYGFPQALHWFACHQL